MSDDEIFSRNDERDATTMTKIFSRVGDDGDENFSRVRRRRRKFFTSPKTTMKIFSHNVTSADKNFFTTQRRRRKLSDEM
jgi:hypothetical protein